MNSIEEPQQSVTGISPLDKHILTRQDMCKLEIISFKASLH